MDYDKIIHATFEWFSVSKAMWFILFFWLSLPVLFLVPIAFDAGFFYAGFSWALQGLYVITYISVLLGLLLLTCFVLNSKNFNSREVSITRFVDSIFLIFCEFFFIFVWNKNKNFRFTQILLLLGSILLGYYNIFVVSIFIYYSLLVFVLLYLLFVFYNALRISFSLTIFFHDDVSIIGAINESWRLTYKKVWQVFFGYFFSIATVLVVFIVVCMILGAIANLLLLNYLTIALSYKMAVSLAALFALAPTIIGYYFGFIEMYSQLTRHFESEKIIKRVLANQVTKRKKIVKSSNIKSKKSVKKTKEKLVKTTKKVVKKKK